MSRKCRKFNLRTSHEKFVNREENTQLEPNYLATKTTKHTAFQSNQAYLVFKHDIILLFICCLVTRAERCPCPDEPEGGIELVSDTKLRDDYKKGSIVVWECKNGKGFGNVYIECKKNGEWTKPSKKCKGVYSAHHC